MPTVGAGFGCTTRLNVSELFAPSASATVNVTAYVRLVVVVVSEALAIALTFTLLPEILADMIASAGAFETVAVSGVFGSDTLPTVAITAVGVPRCTVTSPVMFSMGAVFTVVIVRSASLISKK